MTQQYTERDQQSDSQSKHSQQTPSLPQFDEVFAQIPQPGVSPASSTAEWQRSYFDLVHQVVSQAQQVAAMQTLQQIKIEITRDVTALVLAQLKASSSGSSR